MSETYDEEVTCEECGGDGYFCDDRPTATPNGPHYGPDVECRACKGTGIVIVTTRPMTMQDALDLDAQKLRDMGVDPGPDPVWEE